MDLHLPCMLLIFGQVTCDFDSFCKISGISLAFATKDSSQGDLAISACLTDFG